MRRRAFIVVLAGLPLAGCLMGAEVSVSGDPSRPTFTFRKAGYHLSDRLWFPGELEVEEFTEHGVKVLWWVSAAFGPDRPHTDHVLYGDLPPGTHTNIPSPPPLRPAVLYRVRLSGDGYWGGVFFANIGGKIESSPGTGDQPLRQMRERMNAGR